ncbi:hypothetical protein C7S18_06390 [Ahniella affigens]|uniref:Uncharacterized protein n=1 Tax=Ahniella affigens TaxID=2021234 RepID=A0A2P1PPV4_9GAMM|nr:hypothetical protein [Ahniella affigens]AVP96852.1 hypothetical protein C7S18_06390 [Ahniella affigens]
MSYDLMVFAPSAAPKKRAAFLDWYDEQSEWEEDHSYDNPDVSTPALRAWFMDMIKSFPALNGPFAANDSADTEAAGTDYSIGRSVIYAAFPWSKAEQAYETMFALAEKHGVGFFNASSEQAEVWLPDGTGGLKLAHSD